MQAAVAELPSTTTTPKFTQERSDLAVLARKHLECHPHFRGRLTGLRIEIRGQTVLLSGQLPTFYLKQLVQEAVLNLPGVQSVRNDIDVVNPYGVSSERY